MKESGINYFYQQVAGSSDALQLLYTFEDGAGSIISNMASGISGYSGVLSSVGNFWSIPGTGNDAGQRIIISDASGLYSNNWTKTFVVKKTNNKDILLFSNLGSGSGYAIGINEANKPYFKTTIDNIDYIYTSQNNLSSQNILSVGKIGNNIQFGYYDTTYQKIEYESYNFNYVINRSDSWVLAPSMTGYLDYFIYFNQNLSFNTQQQIYSGFFYTKTGVANVIQTIVTTGITGYTPIIITQTGLITYVSNAGTGLGVGFYTGQFPNAGVTATTTGIISQTIFNSGLVETSSTGIIIGQTPSYFYNSGYAQLFGMETVTNFFPLSGGYVTDLTYDRTPALPIYNKNAPFIVSGYLLDQLYLNSQVNPWLNGLYNDTGDFNITTGRIYITGGSVANIMFFDLCSGSKQRISYPGTGAAGFTYSGQELYLNGLKLLSGVDFFTSGVNLYVTGVNTGISGLLDGNGLIPLYERTGNFSYYTGQTFSRYSSRFFINGLRQQVNNDYWEGAQIDLLSGNNFNYLNLQNVYDNNGNFWA